MLDEILNKWIRAGRVIRRVRQSQDVLVLANREPLDLAELRVLELLAQLLQEISAALFVVFEGHAEARDWSLVPGIWFLVGEKGHGFWSPASGLWFLVSVSGFLSLVVICIFDLSGSIV